jgi:hypothetical protein
MKTWLLSLDLTWVLLFVILGRNTHNEEPTFGGLVQTAAPFLIALALGWIVTRAWQDPYSTRTGIGVTASVLLLGIGLRRIAFDEGIALSFILVTVGFLVLTLIGWRLVLQRVEQRGNLAE